MGILEALLLGILQGVAEFLPISSSGHLALAHNFFSTAEMDYLAFDVLLHLATLAAVCIAYRRDVWRIVKGFFTLIGKLCTGRVRQGLDAGERLFLMLVVASVPLIPMVFLESRVTALSGMSFVIGILLIVNGCMLYVSDRLKPGSVPLEKAGYKKPFYIGLFQMFGVLPGISRSGSTITGGRFCGLNREDAVRFSFLMSLPAILGACVLKLPDFFAGGIEPALVLPCVVGAVTAAVVGFLAIKLLQYLSKNRSFAIFSVYTILVGIAAIIADLVL